MHSSLQRFQILVRIDLTEYLGDEPVRSNFLMSNRSLLLGKKIETSVIKSTSGGYKQKQYRCRHTSGKDQLRREPREEPGDHIITGAINCFDELSLPFA